MSAKYLVPFFFPWLLGACGYRVSVASPWQEKSAVAQTFPFHKEGFSALLDSARLQGKPVFIDFYTSWCGPCKVMDRDVFTDPDLIRYFNSHFISLKVNAELGDGVALAKHYSIKAYPTLLFLDGSGQEQKRLIGIATASRLKAVAKKLH